VLDSLMHPDLPREPKNFTQEGAMAPQPLSPERWRVCVAPMLDRCD